MGISPGTATSCHLGGCEQAFAHLFKARNLLLGAQLRQRCDESIAGQPRQLGRLALVQPSIDIVVGRRVVGVVLRAGVVGLNRALAVVIVARRPVRLPVHRGLVLLLRPPPAAAPVDRPKRVRSKHYTSDVSTPRLAAVADPHPERIPLDREDKRGFLQKIAEFIHRGPESREALIETFADAENNDVIGAESRIMLEGVVRLADVTAGDVMVAAPRMDCVDISGPYETLLYQVIETAHSRFPVFEGERDNIIGILLAKDLLKLQRAPELNIRALLRPAAFVPESKGLNDLLRDFRGNRNHLAMVVDEFGRVAGLITIEDVLEQIVGEIEDEFDEAEDAGDIFALADRTYRVSGDTAFERVAEAFELTLDDETRSEEFDTIGGLVAHEMGHVPKRGERHVVGGYEFVVMHTKGGAVRWFKVSPLRTEDVGG